MHWLINGFLCLLHSNCNMTYLRFVSEITKRRSVLDDWKILFFRTCSSDVMTIFWICPLLPSAIWSWKVTEVIHILSLCVKMKGKKCILLQGRFWVRLSIRCGSSTVLIIGRNFLSILFRLLRESLLNRTVSDWLFSARIHFLLIICWNVSHKSILIATSYP